jgi:hypothetical protein
MTMKALTSTLILAGLLAGSAAWAAEQKKSSKDDLAKAFMTPPNESKVWCYWWWLKGAASKEGITRDFEEMKKQGIAGALLFDAGEAGAEAPRGPYFMSPAWRELYKHAVREADRCGIVLSVNLCSGWNAGGPWVTPEHAAKKIVGAATTVKGPGQVSITLPQPEKVQGFYRDTAVLGCLMPEAGSPQPKLSASSSFGDYLPRLAQDGSSDTRWISNGDKRGMGPTPQKPEYLQFDYDEVWPAAGLYLNPYPDCGPKDIEVQCSDDGKTYRAVRRATVAPRQELNLAFEEVRARHFRVVFLSSHPYQGKESWNVQVAEVALLTRDERDRSVRGSRGVWDRSRTVGLTKFVDGRGRLTWDAPAGTWNVLRVGYTLHGNMIKCVGSGPAGLEIDTMSAEAMDAHFAETGAKLIADAGPLAGKTLQYFHIDSWELGQPTWTPKLYEEFHKRRGYDPLLYLPALLQRTVDDPQTTQRFLADYRRTLGELVAANYYGRFRDLTLRGGLRGTHPESGGPGVCCWIDALQCEGINDVPMGEFWKRNLEPQGPITWPPQTNPTVKQIACAAHIYGKPVCQAEAFTSFACDWIDDPWTMKDIGDEAFCHGLTRNVLCFWVHQPRLDVKPGYQWAHVGTHFDPNITWWNMGHAWLAYLARCQYLLRQGRFVADFAYLQGEEIPAFIAPRDKQQPALPAGFDYDVLNAQVLLNRAAAQDGRLVLPDGMTYRYLVLPQGSPLAISAPVLGKVRQLAENGVTVVGVRPSQTQGLTGYPQCDQEVKVLADTLWGPGTAPAGARKTGAGRVIWGCLLDELVKTDRVPPDIEFRRPGAAARLDWIHRRDGETEIYFVANLASTATTVEAVFRTAGKQPELWDAVTGEIRDLPVWRIESGRTAMPLAFAPRQSWFVVFRKAAEPDGATRAANFPELKPVTEIGGPWQVSFDPKWGGPQQVEFPNLQDWTTRSEDGIRYYSGTAIYRNRFRVPSLDPARRMFLDLGSVKNVARVKLNGRDLGVVWTAPWHVEVTGAVRPGVNDLEIEVANLWPNRLIGDAALPKEKRFATTNVRTYDTMASGTYGCQACEARKKSGQPARLLPSGLLGPVTLRVQGTDSYHRIIRTTYPGRCSDVQHVSMRIENAVVAPRRPRSLGVAGHGHRRAAGLRGPGGRPQAASTSFTRAISRSWRVTGRSARSFWIESPLVSYPPTMQSSRERKNRTSPFASP